MEGQITRRTGLKWFELVLFWFFEETGRSHAYWAFPIAYWAFPIAIGRSRLWIGRSRLLWIGRSRLLLGVLVYGLGVPDCYWAFPITY